MSFPIKSSCFQPDSQKLGDEFSLFDQLHNFTDSIGFCSSRNLTLASIANEEEYQSVRQLFDFLPSDRDQRVWFGLHDPDDSTTGENTSFVFVDGFEDTSFFEEPKKFPWVDVIEPDGSRNSNCISWRLGKAQRHRWGDEDCRRTHLVLCRAKESCTIGSADQDDQVKNALLSFVLLVLLLSTAVMIVRLRTYIGQRDELEKMKREIKHENMLYELDLKPMELNIQTVSNLL